MEGGEEEERKQKEKVDEVSLELEENTHHRPPNTGKLCSKRGTIAETQRSRDRGQTGRTKACTMSYIGLRPKRQ